MRKLVLGLVAFTLFSSTLVLPVLADESQTVNATVQPLLIAVRVDPASVSYGTRQLSATAIPADRPFAVINDGSVPEKFHLKGLPSQPGGWVAGATAGPNTYVHQFSTNGGGSFTIITPGGVLARNNVLPGDSIQVSLQLDMPTSATSLAQQTLPITVVASQYP